jgi:hypothetical protein
MFSKISIDTDVQEHKSDILEDSLIDTHILYFSSKISKKFEKKRRICLPTDPRVGKGETNNILIVA